MKSKTRTVIVTGAASGIGLATARRFSQNGESVVIADLKEEAAKKAAAELSHPGLGIGCDVSDEADVRKTVDAAEQQFGSIEVIVNNAGVMTFRSIEELSAEDWHKVLNVDLLGAFFFTREAFRRMKPGGVIINVASIHAVETTPLVAPYAAAKAALVSFTHSSAIEGKPKGLRVCSVLPGAVETPMLRDNPNVKAGLEKIGRQDVGSPEDIASVIFYLASPDAEFVQGAAVIADGGRLSRL